MFIISFASFAQEGEKNIRYGGYARLYSMGDNPYIVDPDNIKQNPAYSSIYSNFIWGDIGEYNGDVTDGNGQFLGLNYAVNKDFTLGAIFSRNDFLSSSIASIDPFGLVSLINNDVEENVIVPLNNNLEVLGSYRFGNSILGVGISYSSSSNEMNPAAGIGSNGSASQIGINVGYIGKVSREFEFDFSAALLMPSASYEPSDTTQSMYDASQTLIYAMARGRLELSKKFSLVPTVNLFLGSGSIDVDNRSFDLTSYLGLGVGLGLQYKIDNLIIAGGPAFRYDSETEAAVDTTIPELTSSYCTFPAWNFGAEWMFNDWLIGRIGYVASSYSFTYEIPATNTTVNEYSRTGYMEGDIRLGVGFRFGGFNLDATINDDVLREGFNLVGGGTKTFAYLSASFGF